MSEISDARILCYILISHLIKERVNMKKAIVVFIGLTFLASVSLAYAGQKSERLAGIEQSLKDDVPRILCVDGGV